MIYPNGEVDPVVKKKMPLRALISREIMHSRDAQCNTGEASSQRGKVSLMPRSIVTCQFVLRHSTSSCVKLLN